MPLTTIGTDAIDALAVTTAKLAADAVTAAKIATDAVDSAEIAANAVDTAEIAASAVETAKILDANVTLAKIASQAANTVLVRDASSTGVLSAKALATTEILIGDGTGFTAAALSGDVTMANTGAVTIANTAVENAMVATGIDAVKLADGSVTNTELQYINSLSSNAQTQISGKAVLTGSTNNTITTVTGANAISGEANLLYDGTSLDVKNGGTASDVKVYCESSNAHYTSIKSAAHAAYTGGSWTLTLPGTDGAASQYLQTDGAGATTWATVSSADNTPAFQAYLDATITNFPDEAWTKVAINNETFDTDSAYDPTTNYRFTVPAGEGGKYFLFASVSSENANNDGEKFQVGLYLNGSRIYEDIDFDNTSDSYGWNSITGQVTAIVTLAAADYVEVYAYTRSQNGGGTPFIYAGTKNTKFLGYKMIGL